MFFEVIDSGLCAKIMYSMLWRNLLFGKTIVKKARFILFILSDPRWKNYAVKDITGKQVQEKNWYKLAFLELKKQVCTESLFRTCFNEQVLNNFYIELVQIGILEQIVRENA